MGVRRIATAGAVVLVAIALAVSTASPAHAATSTLLEPGAVDRVLVLTIPSVGWPMINETATPNLWRLAQTSATGNLTARTLGRPDAASGYLTLGAGTRAIAARTLLDGAGMEPDEPFGEVSARDAFRIDTGRDVGTGVLQLGIEPILAANAAEQIDVDVGALGDRLAAARRPRAVIANGDGSYPDQPDALRRYAVSALMGHRGVVPGGRTDASLLELHPRAPFGVRYDNEAVVSAFRAVWTPGAVVLVEGSDLVRADTLAQVSTPEQAGAAQRQALRRTDELLGQLLQDVDLTHDAVVVVSPTRARGSVLSAVAVHAPGIPAGSLSSASTRRRGFVLLSDVAPTVLALVGLPRDEDMAGSRFTVGPALPLAQRVHTLTNASDAAVFRDKVRGATTSGYALVLALVLLAAGYGFVACRGMRWRSLVVFAALTVLAYIAVVFLVRAFPMYRHGNVAYLAVLVLASLAIAAVARAVGRRRLDDALLAVLGLVIAVLVLDVTSGAHLQLSSAFGYSATVGIRVAGYGNIAYAILGTCAVLVAGLVAHRVGGRAGALAACGVMFVALLADVAPFWGSDVGGVLSLVPAFGVTAFMLLGIRVRVTLRAAVIAVSATVLSLAALTAADLSRPADGRTHLGRLAQDVADKGLTPLTDTVSRKVDANLATWSSSEWRLALLASGLFLGYVALCERARVRAVVAAVPEMRATFAGLAVLSVLGYAFNDSGVAIPGVALSIGCLSIVVLFVAHASDVATAPVRWRRAQRQLRAT